ncbi:MAG: cell division protein ZapA [Candidatus Cyclobacteriaceae bacterium M3_2C_046]
MHSEELSIKIKIADREYPMKVSAEEEGKIRLAGRMVNDKLKIYKDQFGIDDKQDLLAMVAFDCLAEKLQSDQIRASIDENIFRKINDLNSLISKELID